MYESCCHALSPALTLLHSLSPASMACRTFKEVSSTHEAIGSVLGMSFCGRETLLYTSCVRFDTSCLQDARGRGLAVGEALGLWRDPEAPRLQTAVSAKLATARSGSPALGQEAQMLQASDAKTSPSR